MEAEGFGGCTWHGECQEACPKGISVDWITRLYRDYITATVLQREESTASAAL